MASSGFSTAARSGSTATRWASRRSTKTRHSCCPAHLYTATKLAGEMYCRSYSALYSASHTILRFGIPYGPRARLAAVVPSFVARAQEGKALTIAGDGRQTRQFVYVEDLAAGIVAALAPQAGEPRLQPRRRRADERAPDRRHGPRRRCAGSDRARAGTSGGRAHRARSQALVPRTSSDGSRRRRSATESGATSSGLHETSSSPLADTASMMDGNAATVLRQEPTEL